MINVFARRQEKNVTLFYNQNTFKYNYKTVIKGKTDNVFEVDH